MIQQAIITRRLASQQLTHPANAGPAGLVAAMGAVQAQDYAGGLWAIGLRVPGSTAATVEAAIARREIVRTWPMRGTLHFVPTADVRWMLELMAPRIVAGAAGRLRQLELDGATMRRSAAIFEAALSGGKVVQRRALMELLETAGISTAGQRGVHILWQLAQEGLICFGPHDGKQQTFALLREWLPNAKSLPRDEALAKIALRYFSGHGPATLKDFCWWSGLTVADAKTGLGAVAGQLSTNTVDGETYWFAQQAVPAAQPSAHLLPNYDEYIVGYKDRGAIFDPADIPNLDARSNPFFRHTIALNGRIVGTWQRTVRTRAVTIEVRPFGKFGPAETAALAAAAQRYGQFIGLTATVK